MSVSAALVSQHLFATRCSSQLGTSFETALELTRQRVSNSIDRKGAD